MPRISKFCHKSFHTLHSLVEQTKSKAMPRATINSRSVLVPDFLIFPVLTHSSSTESDSSTDSDLDSFKGHDQVDNMHPLCVSTILQRVFSYLSFWQQKKCRLVCRTWNAELLQLMRKQSKVNLTKLLASSSLPSSDLATISSSLPSILPTLQSLNLMCTSFIIEHESQDMGDFFREANLIVKYIELRNVSWDLSHVQKYILQELPYLEELRIPIQCALPESHRKDERCSPIITDLYPNIKTIVVTYTLKDLHIYSRQDTHISSLLEILQAAPNLEEIYYPNIVQFTSPFENPARVLFKNIIYNGSMALSRLSSLKIDTFLNNEDLYSLAERNLPLKSLQLTLTPDVGCDDLYELLYSLQGTLEVLTFTFRDGFRLTKRFPRLEHLKNMSVILWNGYLDNLGEISKLKNLVVVLMEVDSKMIASGNSGGDRGSPSTSFSERSQIKQLELHAVTKGSDPLVIKTIRLSPFNLKRLTIDHATDQYLRVIFRSLRVLEELTILYGDWTESGLTGMPKEYCKMDIAQKEFYAMGLKQFPGISDLKQLQNLILTGIITDISLLLGVIKCPSIRSLELIARRYSKISDDTVIKLVDSMDLHFLRMTNFTPGLIVSTDAIDFIKDKFSGREFCINF